MSVTPVATRSSCFRRSANPSNANAPNVKSRNSAGCSVRVQPSCSKDRASTKRTIGATRTRKLPRLKRSRLARPVNRVRNQKANRPIPARRVRRIPARRVTRPLPASVQNPMSNEQVGRNKSAQFRQHRIQEAGTAQTCSVYPGIEILSVRVAS